LLPPAGPSVSEFPAYSNKTLYFFFWGKIR
jgi:hypothetical protein